MATQIDLTYHADVKYGLHERNTLDIWLVKSNTPRPLVVFYHGGAFIGGDKRDFELEHLTGFLRAGVSFAAVNYRYQTDKGMPKGILDSVNDCRCALQWIRHKAPQWNIDTDRIGAYGKSAGAGTSLWIAFHDDMAGSPSDLPPCPADTSPPHIQESTRLKVVGALATQSTYDMVRWLEVFQGCPVPSALREELLAYALNCYSLKHKEQLFKGKGVKIRSALDFLAQMSSDAPPMYVRNATPNCFSDMNNLLHHPLHARALKEKADLVNLESYVYAPEADVMPSEEIDLVSFFLAYL